MVEQKKTATRRADSFRKNEGFGRIMFYFSSIRGQSPTQPYDCGMRNEGLAAEGT
jgi:hypothetical protein